MIFSEPADDFDAGTTEDFLGMGRVVKFAAQVLPREMQVAMQVATPIRTIADIVNNAVVGNPFFVGVIAVVEQELGVGDKGFVSHRCLDYTRNGGVA